MGPDTVWARGPDHPKSEAQLSVGQYWEHPKVESNPQINCVTASHDEVTEVTDGRDNTQRPGGT